MFLPAAVRYLNNLLTTAERADDLGMKAGGVLATAQRVNDLVDALNEKTGLLASVNQELGGDDVVSKAEHMRTNIIPAMNDVRDVVDRLERVVPDDLWPVPAYRDMLFVK